MDDSRIMKLLRSSYDGDLQEPQSRIEAIVQNIMGADNLLEEPQSRLEELLLDMSGRTQYSIEVNIGQIGADGAYETLGEIDNHAEMVYEGMPWSATFSFKDGWEVLSREIYTPSMHISMGGKDYTDYEWDGKRLLIPKVTGDLKVNIRPTKTIWTPGRALYTGNRYSASGNVYYKCKDRIDRYTPENVGVEFGNSDGQTIFVSLGKASNKVRIGVGGYVMTRIDSLVLPEDASSMTQGSTYIYGSYSSQPYDPGWQRSSMSVWPSDLKGSNTFIITFAPLSDGTTIDDETKQLIYDNVQILKVPVGLAKVN